MVGALLIAAMAARHKDAAWTAPFAALLFLALAFPGGTPWLGLYRVDMLGVALSLASIVVLSYCGSKRASVVAGVLAGLALLAGIDYLWEIPRLAREIGLVGLLGAAFFLTAYWIFSAFRFSNRPRTAFEIVEMMLRERST